MITAALFGLIFGTGLVISGMTDPNRILAFLDVTGDWNPSLALVMGGAIAIAAPAFALARRKRTSVFGGTIALPDRKPITFALVAGAALFGVGWGLSGLCPGPAIVLLSTLQTKAVVFFGGVLGGIALAAVLPSRAGESLAHSEPLPPNETATEEKKMPSDGLPPENSRASRRLA